MEQMPWKELITTGIVIVGFFWGIVKFGFARNNKIDSLEEKLHVEVEARKSLELELKLEIKENKQLTQNQLTEIKAHYMESYASATEEMRTVSRELSLVNRELGELRGMMTILINQNKPK